MKKLLTILFVCFGFIATAQVVVPRGSKSVAPQDAYLYTTFGLKIPVYADTTAANLMVGHDSLGLFIQTLTPAATYFRAVSTGSIHKWIIHSNTPASPIWGLITGTLSSQTDLQTALNAKQNLIATGTTAQYFRGDLSLATFPTDLSSFTNGPLYLTAINATNSITGAGTVVSPLKLVNDAASPGASKYYGTDNGGVRGWLNDTTTIYLTQIGTGSPQIPLLYAANGGLRSARLVPGTFTTPFMNADSGVGVHLDTLGPGGAAYKAWIIAQYGPPTGYGGGTLQQVITNNDTLTKNDTIVGSSHNLFFKDFSQYNIQSLSSTGDTTFNFEFNPTASQATIEASDLSNNSRITWRPESLQLTSPSVIANTDNFYLNGTLPNNTTTTKALVWDDVSKQVAWQTVGGGSGTNIYTSNGVISSTNRYVEGTMSGAVPTTTLHFDSLFQIYINASGVGNGLNVTGNQGTSSLQVGANEVVNTAFGVTSGIGIIDNRGDSVMIANLNAPTDSAWIFLKSSKIRFRQTAGAYQFQNLVQANDTTTYKPFGVDISGNVKRMDGWAGSGGVGGSTNGVGRDTVQSYSSGTTLTQSASTNYIQLNPASVQATLTITTLGSGGTWHTSNDLYIVAGGTVTSGAVLTSLTITAGSGMTLIQAVTPTTINAGEVIHYHKIGSFLYRIN